MKIATVHRFAFSSFSLPLSLFLFFLSGMTLARSWSVVRRAHIQAFTFSHRWLSRSQSAVRRAQIQASSFRKLVHTSWTTCPYHKKWRAAGTSTRADACAFTSEPQLSSYRRRFQTGETCAHFRLLGLCFQLGELREKIAHILDSLVHVLETLLRNWHSC